MNSGDGGDLLVIEGLTVDIQQKGILKNLNLRVRRGEIHSLFGDEAVQRSVLLKVIAGELPYYGGNVVFDGLLVRKPSPERALHMGIEIIDGSAKGFLNLSGAENFFCEKLRMERAGCRDKKAMRLKAEEFFDQLAVDIDLDVPLSTLSPERRKLVEIARSVGSSPRLLLIDESTIDGLKSSCGPETIEKLYFVFTLLASGGTTILSSSNDMDQLFKFADRVSVVKCGSIDTTMQVTDIDKIQLVQMAYSSILSRSDLEKSNFELFYLKQIYESIIDSLAFPVIVTDTRRKMLIANIGAEKLFKTDRDRLLSLPLHEVLGVDAGVVENIENELQNTSRTQFSCIPEIRPGVDVFACPVLDETDSYMGMLLVFSRIADTFDVGEAIRANSERYNSEKRIIKVVHEIKNPLGIILNYLRLIRTEQSKDKISDNVLHIENEVKRISRLLEQLKGKRDAGKTYGVQGMRVSAIIDEIVDLLIPSIANNEIKFSCSFEYDPVIPFDPDLLRQVVLNVMLNGIEAMPGGGTLDIACRSQTLDGREYIVMEFVDTGVGIEKENMGKIFEPFYTTKLEKKSSGIGLSICQEIVSNLDGFFRVESSLGQGSTFRIFLPLSPGTSGGLDD